MVTLGALLFPAYLLAPLSSSLSLFPLPTFLKQDKDIVCIFFRRKEGCHLLRANVTPLPPPPPSSHTEAYASVGRCHIIFLFCWWICNGSFFIGRTHSLLPSPSISPCSVFQNVHWGREASQTPLLSDTQWREREKRPCLVLLLMSKSMHLSLKRVREGR